MHRAAGSARTAGVRAGATAVSSALDTVNVESIRSWSPRGARRGHRPAGAWSDWASEGGALTSDIVVERNADGRLELFVRGTDNAVWHKWQIAPNSSWSGWASEGGVITSSITVGRNADGRLELFVRGTDGAVWHKWQTAPSNGWSGWASQGGVITSNITIGINADGRLELLVRGATTRYGTNGRSHPWQLVRLGLAGRCPDLGYQCRRATPMDDSSYSCAGQTTPSGTSGK